MKEWAYEEEYRLIIDNTFVKREKTVERNLSYNPKKKINSTISGRM